MENKKMSFEEWLNTHNTLHYTTLTECLVEYYNKYQKYFGEAEPKSLKWEDIMKSKTTIWTLDNWCQINEIKLEGIFNPKYKEYFDTKEIAEQELARMQWIMIAWEANDRKVISRGWYIRNVMGHINIGRNEDHDECTIFKTQEFCQQAYEENKEIVHIMLEIKG